MHAFARHLLLLSCLSAALSAAPAVQPWQKITDPAAAATAAAFANPPHEYSAQFTWGWGGPVDRAVIARDLDGMKALGVYAAAIEPKAGMTDPYLSPGYFDLIKVAVEEAKRRDMHLWIMDEGDYPSGLAGGKFTVEQPDLRMQVLAPPERVSVAGGATLSRPLARDIICAVATNLADGTVRVLDLGSGQLNWTAPPGDWQVAFSRTVFRSLATRSANNPGGPKDNTHSLMDFLSPAATQKFKEWTFDGYQQAIGDELGKTVLGFRGDEPAFVPNPWTPRLLIEFQQRKGYDVRPYLAAFAGAGGRGGAPMTDEQRRAYADYNDVWSDLFRDSYFNLEGGWCADHGVEMQLHIEHEEFLTQLATADGDFFKCFRNIQVPGIDIIWHQIWMDNPADFPKLASSAAHLYGHPRAMCEAFAAYTPAPNLAQSRWLLDFLMTRGINRIEYMFWSASSGRGGGAGGAGGGAPRGAAASAAGGTATAGVMAAVAPASDAAGSAAPGAAPAAGARRGGGAGGGVRYYRDPGFPAVAAYVNRVTYLLGEGRPGAQIGLYIPSSSFWFADAAAGKTINDSLLTLAHQLIEHQRDFDFVDEQALASPVLTLKDGELVNLSGQGYRAIIVPPATAISQAALDKLRAFAAAGGKVVFIGAAPALVAGRTFLHATGPADISWATLLETEVAVTPRVLAALPRPDLALAPDSPLVSYNHRRLRDADVYFIFNSGDAKATLAATLAGTGAAQVWDANTGKVAPLAGAAAAGNGTTRVALELAPWATTIVVIGAAPATTADAN